MNRRLFRDVIVDFMIASVLTAGVLTLFKTTVINGDSMENTLAEGDYVIMSKQAYKLKSPQRGDIVLIESDLYDSVTGQKRLIIKRVVGMPGDSINIENNKLYINGEYYSEDYIKGDSTPALDIPPQNSDVTVPEDHYYVLGDNRLSSVDSRTDMIGFIDSACIKGKAVFRLYPFSTISRF